MDPLALGRFRSRRCSGVRRLAADYRRRRHGSGNDFVRVTLGMREDRWKEEMGLVELLLGADVLAGVPYSFLMAVGGSTRAAR